MNLEQFERKIRLRVINNYCPSDQTERDYKDRLWIQLKWFKNGFITDVFELPPDSLLLKKGGIKKSMYHWIKLDHDLEIWIKRPEDSYFWKLEE